MTCAEIVMINLHFKEFSLGLASRVQLQLATGFVIFPATNETRSVKCYANVVR